MSLIVKKNGVETSVTDVIVNENGSSRSVNFVEVGGRKVWERPNRLHIKIVNNKISRIWFNYIAAPDFKRCYRISATKLSTIKGSDGVNSGCVGCEISVTSAEISSDMTPSQMFSIVNNSLVMDSKSVIICNDLSVNPNYNSNVDWIADLYQEKRNGIITYPTAFITTVTSTLQDAVPHHIKFYNEFRGALFWYWETFSILYGFDSDEREMRGDSDYHIVYKKADRPYNVEYSSGPIKGACTASDSGIEFDLDNSPIYKVIYKYKQAGGGSYTYNLTFNKEIL